MVIEVTLIILIFLLSLLILGKIWGTLKRFHHRNDTYMDLVFILLFFLEQFLFLYLYYSEVALRELWVGLVVLAVTITASLDKLMMYSRHKYLQEIINSNLVEKKELFNTITNQKQEIKDRDGEMRIMDKIISDFEDLE